MRTVFADSFCFFALLNNQDAAHQKVTTGWVLTELGDGLAHPLNRPSFLQTVDTLRAQSNVTIVPCNDDLLLAAIDLYRRRPDKEWPLTDCLSFVVMQQQGLSEALTGDRHFEQAGFVALLK
jgi:uncharacterized protein